MNNSTINKAIKQPVDWQKIKLVAFDCDGVLTDGRMIYHDTQSMTKSFSAHDGMGFSLLHKAGLISVVISGKKSQALGFRCTDLKINYLYDGIVNKLACLESLLDKLELTWQETVYMGDDWNDVPCMQKVAFSACPNDVMPEIKNMSDYVTQRNSGESATREFIDYVLYQKGLYQQVVNSYLKDIT